VLHGFALQAQSFRSNTLGVRVDVLVTDGRKPVGGLTALDFDVRDNGVAQAIQLVDASDVPLNVVLALDSSASTTGARQTDLIAASEALLAGLEPVDRAALTTFSHAVARRTALTNHHRADRAAFYSDIGRGCRVGARRHAHFVIFGEVGEKRTREIAEAFERFSEAMARVFPNATASPVPTRWRCSRARRSLRHTGPGITASRWRWAAISWGRKAAT